MTQRTGQCLCGAVTFSATNVPDRYGACHCEMCRRWTGSALVGATVPKEGVTWTGQDNIQTLQSSDWAERAWCTRCGTGLYYSLTIPGPMSGNYEIPVGLFDDADGMTLDGEIYVDHAIASLTYTGDHARLTRKETLAKFGISDDFDTPAEGE